MSCYTLKKIFGRNRREFSYNLAFFFHHNLSFILLYSFLSFAFPVCLSLILPFTYTPIVTCFRTLSGPIKYHSIKKDHLHHAPVLSACITGPRMGMDIYQGFWKPSVMNFTPRAYGRLWILAKGMKCLLMGWGLPVPSSPRAPVMVSQLMKKS